DEDADELRFRDHGYTSFVLETRTAFTLSEDRIMPSGLAGEQWKRRRPRRVLQAWEPEGALDPSEQTVVVEPRGIASDRDPRPKLQGDDVPSAPCAGRALVPRDDDATGGTEDGDERFHVGLEPLVSAHRWAGMHGVAKVGRDEAEVRKQRDPHGRHHAIAEGVVGDVPVRHGRIVLQRVLERRVACRLAPVAG